MKNAIFDCRKKNKIFKTLAISKIIHFSLITNVSTEIINELNKTHTKKIIRNGHNPKIVNKKMWIFYLKLSAYNAPG